jgi:hypothetical protein
MTALRPIKPIPLIGIEPKPISSELPNFKWTDPTELFVEADYQRNLTAGSIKLIRSITADFNWLNIKPVICAKGKDGKLVVLDGQHTAIAAISRGIKSVPIMLVNAPCQACSGRA